MHEVTVNCPSRKLTVHSRDLVTTIQVTERDYRLSSAANLFRQPVS